MKRRILIVLLEALLIIVIVYFFFFFILEHWKIPCLFHELTNLNCPGCGMTRAIKSLLKLDFMAAIQYNLLLVIWIPLFGFYIISFISHYIRTGNFIHIHQVYSKKMIYSMLMICIVFGITRNLPYLLHS